MVGHGSKFGRKKEAAVASLLTARNVEEAARIVGIGTQTLYRWMKEPEFKIAYREARHAALSQASARLQQSSSAAVSTLLKIMVDSGAGDSARVRAADRILVHAREAIEIEDLNGRVVALEEAAELAGRGEKK
jgi:transposase-like protein